MRTFAFAVVAATSAAANADLFITELMSKSDATEDWFELTNFGDSAVDITGWAYDDESADPAESVTIEDVTSIGAGESIIVLQLDNNADKAAELDAFTTFWGGLDGVQIATLGDAASGMGKGDGATVFNAAGEIVTQAFYGDGDATDPMDLIGDTHAGVWAGGEEWDSANYIGGDWVGGADFDGQFGIFASAELNGEGVNEFGSLGSAVPAPGMLSVLGVGGLVALRRRR